MNKIAVIVFLVGVLLLAKCNQLVYALTQAPPNVQIYHNVSSSGRTFNYQDQGFAFDFSQSIGAAYVKNTTSSQKTFDWTVDCRQDLTTSGYTCWSNASNTKGNNIPVNAGEIVEVYGGHVCVVYQIDIHYGSGGTYGYTIPQSTSCSNLTPTRTPTPKPNSTPTRTPTPKTPTPTPGPGPTYSLTCGTYNAAHNTIPVRVSSASVTNAWNMQMYDSNNIWYWNAGATLPITVSSVDNKGVTFGIVNGRTTTVKLQATQYGGVTTKTITCSQAVSPTPTSTGPTPTRTPTPKPTSTGTPTRTPTPSGPTPTRLPTPVGGGPSVTPGGSVTIPPPPILSIGPYNSGNNTGTIYVDSSQGFGTYEWIAATGNNGTVWYFNQWGTTTVSIPGVTPGQLITVIVNTSGNQNGWSQPSTIIYPPGGSSGSGIPPPPILSTGSYNSSNDTGTILVDSSQGQGTYEWVQATANGGSTWYDNSWGTTTVSIPGVTPGQLITVIVNTSGNSNEWSNPSTITYVRPTATPTPTQAPWIKIVDGSYEGGGGTNPIDNAVPPNPIKFDTSGDDPGNGYFIDQPPGSTVIGGIVGSADNISPGRISNTGWSTIGYTTLRGYTFNNFLEYVKARKKYTILTNPNLSEIANDGIYYFNGNITIDDSNKSVFDNKKVVLLVQNSVSLGISNGIFAPSNGAVAILTGTVNFYTGDETNPTTIMNEVNGIFVADSLHTGVQFDTGLKIKGNFSTLDSGLYNYRKQDASANKKPSLLIVFDPTLYITLLSYLSVDAYDWQLLH